MANRKLWWDGRNTTGQPLVQIQEGDPNDINASTVFWDDTATGGGYNNLNSLFYQPLNSTPRLVWTKTIELWVPHLSSNLDMYSFIANHANFIAGVTNFRIMVATNSVVNLLKFNNNIPSDWVIELKNYGKIQGKRGTTSSAAGTALQLQRKVKVTNLGTIYGGGGHGGHGGSGADCKSSTTTTNTSSGWKLNIGPCGEVGHALYNGCFKYQGANGPGIGWYFGGGNVWEQSDVNNPQAYVENPKGTRYYRGGYHNYGAYCPPHTTSLEGWAIEKRVYTTVSIVGGKKGDGGKGASGNGFPDLSVISGKSGKTGTTSSGCTGGKGGNGGKGGTWGNSGVGGLAGAKAGDGNTTGQNTDRNSGKSAGGYSITGWNAYAKNSGSTLGTVLGSKT